MQVTETTAEGLKREYRVSIPAKDIDGKVTSKLTEVGRDIQLPGFRRGKAPLPVLKMRLGKSVLGEVLEEALQESVARTLEDKELKPAMQPQIEIGDYKDGGDLEYTMSLEVLPDFTVMDLATIELERLRIPVAEDVVDRAVASFAENRKESEPAPDGHEAAAGDIAVIDFRGTVDGEAFDGGTAEDYHLNLGANTFVPGFEDQLIGAKAGDRKDVKIAFPEDYPAENLAGQDAVFDVTVKELRTSKLPEIDDEFAKSLGAEDLNALREAVKADIEREYSGVSRTRLKRDLLDILADGHEFELPPGMVEVEFEAIWTHYEERKAQDRLDEDEKDKSEDALKAEYRDIAARRVRLGIVLSAIGAGQDIEVSNEELNRAILREAQNYPGRQREVMEAYQKNAEMRDGLKAPIYEDKVIDYIVELAQVSEKDSTLEEVIAMPETDAAPAGEAAA
ncbi:MAG: trigger factor [Rhodospirillaceae bacterium]|nr:trigger factor [Rhodospirillaceae bacterium]